MHHFIIGLDEMCIMSDHHGGLHAIACAQKKKHEKLIQDCRVSIASVCTGTVGGTSGFEGSQEEEGVYGCLHFEMQLRY